MSLSHLSTGHLVDQTDWNSMIDVVNALRTPRVTSAATSTTPSPNADTDDVYVLTALASGATFAAPAGTPTNEQRLMIRILDNGVAQSLAWNAIYIDGGTPLPSITIANKTMHVGFIYNSTSAKWMCVGVQTQA